MSFRNRLAAVVLAGAVAAPVSLSAQVNPPTEANAHDFEAEFLAHFWCGQVFLHESIRQGAQGDAALSEHYAMLMIGMGSDTPGRFLRAGHSDAQREALIGFYRTMLDAMFPDYPYAFRRALGECEEAFSRAAAPVVPGLAEGIAAYEARDYETARHLLAPLAEAGNAEAQLQIGIMHRYGRGVAKDVPKAVEWYERAASQSHIPAMLELANVLLAGIDYPLNGLRATGLLAFAADRGDTYAQYILSDILMTGAAGAPVDYFRAEQYLRRAAEAGHSSAQTSLGELYNFGFILSQDYAEAAKWFRLAVDGGGIASVAHVRLAVLYIHGRGVPQDFDEAERLMERMSSSDAAQVRELIEQVRGGN